MNSVEKRKSRQEKKKNKQQVYSPVNLKLKTISGISPAQSLKVWGAELVCSDKKLNPLRMTATSQIFNKREFNFKKVVLQGLSISQMAQRFLQHNWGKFTKRVDSAEPGYYLVSYQNPLVNLYLPQESEIINSQEVIYLDLCLTIELLVMLVELGQEIPPLFYRTSATNGHDQKICVGLKKGKISFVTENIARHYQKMGVCLAKYESWMF